MVNPHETFVRHLLGVVLAGIGGIGHELGDRDELVGFGDFHGADLQFRFW